MTKVPTDGERIENPLAALWKRARGIAERQGDSLDDDVKEAVGDLATELPKIGGELGVRAGEHTLRVMVELAMYQRDKEGYLARKRETAQERIASARARAGDIAGKAEHLYAAERAKLGEQGTGTYGRGLAKRGLNAARGIFGKLRQDGEALLDELASSEIATSSERRIPGCRALIGEYAVGEVITRARASRVRNVVSALERDEAMDATVRSQVLELYSGFATTDVDEVLERASDDPTLGGRMRDQEALMQSIALLEERRESFARKASLPGRSDIGSLAAELTLRFSDYPDTADLLVPGHEEMLIGEYLPRGHAPLTKGRVRTVKYLIAAAEDILPDSVAARQLLKDIAGYAAEGISGVEGHLVMDAQRLEPQVAQYPELEVRLQRTREELELLYAHRDALGG